MLRTLILLLTFVLSACSAATAATAPADSVTLQQLEHTARQQVSETIQNPILRQVNTDLGQYTFFYADAQRTTVYTVTAPDGTTPASEWELRLNNDPRLMNNPAPDMDLSTLKITPQTLADALRQEWEGCEITGLTLYYHLQEEDLMWTGFCRVAGGLLSGSMSNRTGVFVAMDGAPAPPPPTAEPN
jgi:hypothetical protein